MSSLFEQLGGQEAVDLTVDKFYERVLKDERVKHFFDDVDMVKQRQHQKQFLTYAFGGSSKYSGKAMRQSHKQLVQEKGLSDEHFDAIVEDLVETLKELEVSENLIEQVKSIAGDIHHRNDILNR
ncbi:globin [Gloeothece citriformis PCC 7424]|uniref:Group 1 truncated hemoglobin n=1 Tax=Gloeothece citriformis (strain PCC 7424) TaxID=65393 RepID=B7KI32_GLOC7|nr:group 1 truncated hemoglobin [Gloeothece citriformis]ACK73519.1 globin [Gloeothece citriformis PCC 7424]